jgi:hypothetical protein
VQDINRDFIETPIEPAALVALLQALQQGAISIDTFLYNMKQGEILSPARSVEEEKPSLPKLNAPPKLPIVGQETKPQVADNMEGTTE